MSSDASQPLAGFTIVTTRDEPGDLDGLLVQRGAEVVHVPLIEIVDAADGGEGLAAALAALDDFEWLIVTSRHGAVRVAADVARHPHVRLAAVGTRTAAELSTRTGRQVDVVPDRQTAADLLAAMPLDGDGARVLVAHADRADPLLVDGLTDRGFAVSGVIAYRTLLRRPSAEERAAALASDAVAFASGSAAEAWAATIGVETPAFVVAIGPTTARVAGEHGITVTDVAAEHSVPGLVAAIVEALTRTSPDRRARRIDPGSSGVS